jgi:hypothetical protein
MMVTAVGTVPRDQPLLLYRRCHAQLLLELPRPLRRAGPRFTRHDTTMHALFPHRCPVDPRLSWYPAPAYLQPTARPRMRGRT